MSIKNLCLRAETKPFEFRTPLTPEDAKKLIAHGCDVSVEMSMSRIFTDDEYAEVGCKLLSPGSWPYAKQDTVILGLKELKESKALIKHKHIYFAHAYRKQPNSRALLDRFKRGAGMIYDLESLVDRYSHKRSASFGYWAGYSGAAMSLLLWVKNKCHINNQPDIPHYFANKEAMLSYMRDWLSDMKLPTICIMGTNGRASLGAIDLFEEFDISATSFGRDYIGGAGNRDELLNFDTLINCVSLSEELIPFISKDDIKKEKNLSIIVDISCDSWSENHLLPIYQEATNLSRPARRIQSNNKFIDIVAIDNLPSFLPYESSIDFSSQLYPHLKSLLIDNDAEQTWEIAAAKYRESLAESQTY